MRSDKVKKSKTGLSDGLEKTRRTASPWEKDPRKLAKARDGELGDGIDHHHAQERLERSAVGLGEQAIEDQKRIQKMRGDRQRIAGAMYLRLVTDSGYIILQGLTAEDLPGEFRGWKLYSVGQVRNMPANATGVWVNWARVSAVEVFET